VEDSTQWLWPGWIPKGRLSLLIGPPGPKLTRLGVWLTTTVLRGGPCPDGKQPLIDTDRPIVWLDTEGNHARLLERLRAIEFPKDRVFWPVDPQKPEEDSPVNLAEERWLEIVAEHAAFRRPAWVIVDRLGSRRGKVVPETYRALEVMAKIAREVGGAVTFLYHQDADRTTAPERSAQWASVAARMATIMTLKTWGSATKDMRFRVVRTALGKTPDPLRLRFHTHTPEVVPRPAAPPGLRVERAVALLEAELARGPRTALEVTDRAWWDHRISPRTLQRAKRQRGVKSYRSAGRWWWVLGVL